MSDFKDFLDQLKIRLTNPLIFSFLISFSIFNWRIILGAFYLDKISLSELGFNNFLDYISAKVNWYNGLVGPLISAIAYTLISPLLRFLVQLFNTWINKKGNAQIHKVASESFIPYEIYDQLLEEVHIQRKRNEDMLNENILLSKQQSEYKTENQSLQRNLELSSQDVYEAAKRFDKISDQSPLVGKWKRTIKQQSHTIQEDEIVIHHSSIEIKQESGGYYPASYIRNFMNHNDYISFIEDMKDQEELVVKDPSDNIPKLKINYYNNLQKHGDHHFSGNYNGSYDVTFVRIPG